MSLLQKTKHKEELLLTMNPKDLQIKEKALNYIITTVERQIQFEVSIYKYPNYSGSRSLGMTVEIWSTLLNEVKETYLRKGYYVDIVHSGPMDSFWVKRIENCSTLPPHFRVNLIDI